MAGAISCTLALLQMTDFLLPIERWRASTHISSHQLLCVVDRGHSCLSLGDVGVVVGVVGDEQHLWKSQHKHQIPVRDPGMDLFRLIIAYPAVRVSSGTESDRRCDNPAQLWAERWLETFPADLRSDTNCIEAVNTRRETDGSRAAYRSQYQLKLVSHWLRNGSGWICPKTISADRKRWDSSDTEGYLIQERNLQIWKSCRSWWFWHYQRLLKPG